MDSNSIFLNKYQKVPVQEYPNTTPNKPFVSVKVLTYNHEKYIAQCLDGILQQQTTFNFEILVGEDCSSDRTRDICIQYAKDNPNKIRLFLHSRDNNILIEKSPTWYFNAIFSTIKSRGKYIAICEGDDYWTDPFKLQKQVNFLENNLNYSACAHLSDVIFDGVEIKNEERFKRNTKKTIYKTKDCLDSTPFHTSSLVYRSEYFDLDGYLQFGFKFFRDYPQIIILSTLGLIKRFPEVMSVYRRNKSGISENISFEKLYKINIETAKALNNYIDNFYVESFYIKGYWHRMKISFENNFIKKSYHFLYFFFSSFYIFPKNIKKIFRSFKILVRRNV